MMTLRNGLGGGTAWKRTFTMKTRKRQWTLVHADVVPRAYLIAALYKLLATIR